MPIALRLNFVDVVSDNSLKHIYANGSKIGYQFNVRLSYYRGHFLSTINEISLKVDGEEVLQQDITYSLKEREYGIAQLHDLVDVFWPITEPATIKVMKKGGLEAGEHKIEFHLIFRSPYMAIGEASYMPVDSSGTKVLTMAKF